MKNRTKRWLLLARNWGIFLGALLLIWIILLITRPNVTYAILEKYFSGRDISDRVTVTETWTDFVIDICDPETEITYYSLEDLAAGKIEGVNYNNALYILNDRYYIHNEDFSLLQQETEIDGYGSVTMVRGAAEALRELLAAAETETGERFALAESYVNGADSAADHGNDCYLYEYYDTSEHITGTSVDLLVPGQDYRTYMRSDLAKWLQKNAWRFGFAVRYPFWEGEWTGVFFQPWHIHYVGRAHAAILYESRMPLEEYLDKSYGAKGRFYFLDYTDAPTGENTRYVVFRQTKTNGQIYIPDTLTEVEVSFDNTYGYYYVTGVLE